MVPWWVAAPVLVALVAVAVAARRSRSVQALPLADTPALGRARRRTDLVRAGLVAAIGAALAAAYLVAPRPTGELSSLVSPERSTVVVLDISQSVSDLVYREIARTLDGIMTASGEHGRVGLVLFSDVGLEALPPGSNAAELAAFIRFFRPRSEQGVAAKPIYYRAAGPTEQIGTQYPLNPWFGRFSGGTQISAGLRVAREALEREGQKGRVVLLSDLAEAEEDLERLTSELVVYDRDDSLDLRVVALPPATPEQKAVFERIAGGPDHVVDSLALGTGNAGEGEPAAAVSWPFVAVLLGLALALAASELFCVPLVLGRRHDAERVA
jgi:hypothetical protein